MVSFGGGGKSKSKSESRTAFPGQFFDDAYSYFGDEPEFDPQFEGFEDFDRLESTTYDTSKARVDDVYRGLKRDRAEQLSLSGLLNSPARYIEGGIDDSLDKNYMATLQQAARDAALSRLGAEEREAGRKTAFNVDTQKTILTNFLNKLILAAQAGRYSQGQSDEKREDLGIDFSGLINMFGDTKTTS